MQYQFDVTLAAKYSLDQAVFVHRIYLWVLHNQANRVNFHEGQYWTYDSAAALAETFPFWSARQVQRIVNQCRENGLILTRHLGDNARDRTLWYTVTETVKCIYANGEMDYTKRLNPLHQTVKCIKGASKDQVKTQVREGARTFGEFENVRLTDAELDKLMSRWPASQVEKEIEALSAYMRSKGKRYADHYATLLNWLKRDYPPAGPAEGGLIEEDWCSGDT